MPGLAPGAVLGGRYTLSHLILRSGALSRWSAIDGSRGAAVVLATLPASDPQAPAVFDAAYRAAGVDNPHLVRVLDAGRDGELIYIAEEQLDGGVTLGELAGRGGLDAQEVRRLVGESALALDAGQRRGLHHLFLSPDSVIRMPDGQVKIAGLATVAALAGQDHIGGPRALRRDAQGLVALAYAGLTGRWPYGAETSLEPAPRLFGGVPRPSEIAVGVPADLDTICHQSLSEGLGPTSPADFATQIAPWGEMTVSPLALTPDPAQSVMDSVSDPTVPVPLAPTAPQAPVVGVNESAATAPVPAGGPAPGPAHEPGSADEPSPQRPPGAADGEAGGATAAATSTVSGAGATVAGVSAALAGTRKRIGSSGARLAGAVSGGLSGLAKGASSKAGEAIGERRNLRAEQRRDDAARQVPFDQTRDESGFEAPAPLLPPEAGAPPSPAQKRVVLTVFAAIVAIAGLLGAIGASRIGKGTDINSILGGGKASTSSSTRSSTTSTTTTTSGPAAGQALGFVGASGYDPPPGDGRENNALVPRVYDEDPNTYWQSEGYQGPGFGGLKTGVGLILDFGQQQTPTSINLVLPRAESLELYLANEQTRDGASKIGTVTNQSGNVTVTTNGTASGQYLIVWFTDAPQLPDGSYRAQLSEITAYG